MSSKIKHYAGNISWAASEKILRLFSGFFVGLVLARYLGPEDFGRFSYALSWCGIWASFAWLGVGETVVRDIVKVRFEERVILGSVLLSRAIGASVSFSLCLLSSVFVFEAMGIPYIVIVLIGGSLCFSEVLGGIWLWFQAKGCMKPIMIARNSALLVSSLFKLLVVTLGGGLVALAFSSLLEVLTLSLFMLCSYRLIGQSLSSWTYNYQATKTVIRESLPLALSAIVVSLNSKLDQVVIGFLLDAESVGIYAVAIRFSEVLWMIPPVLIMVIAPRLFYNSLSESQLLKRCSLASRYMLIFAIVPCLLTTLFFSQYIGLILGEGYHQASQILNITIWLSLFIFLEAPINQYFITESRSGVIATKSLLALFSNVALCFYLVPLYGLEGAATSTIIAQVLSLILICFIKGGGGYKKIIRNVFFMANKETCHDL